MFDSLFKKKIEVYSPTTGVIRPLSSVEDNTFSKGFIGEGFAIDPEDSIICAPVEGVVGTIFPTKHALGISTEKGIDFILHVGIDTVKLKGIGFEALVEEGAKVRVGTPLLKVDYSYIQDSGYQTWVILVASNAKKFNLESDLNTKVNIRQKVGYCEI